MKTCEDCVNYAKCVENCNTYHASRLTPDSDVSDRCEHFQPTVVYCKDCKYYSVDNALLGMYAQDYLLCFLCGNMIFVVMGNKKGERNEKN